ncbi:putative phosphatase YcdX [Caloramator mitchellensis]|uniref:Putative phosphatase YcdX n=1 Tax=Caloramator mitchellensis TaxID=908809 RepID=A0A0R3JU79_CALMK|nr:phosphatase [Caloramator mitchellensis]KRQ87104.1 putative phosphatase YcdX [Caloramator mitchellensis]
MFEVVIDTHTHTVASGHAYSTLIENCTEAAKNGMKMIAMTDHGPAMPGGPHIFHFGNLKVIPEEINGVKVLKGVELNIIDYNGNVDLDDARLSKLDFVIASLHDVCIQPGSKAENTRALIGAMKNKYVCAIAHPGNPAFEIDIDEMLKAAKEFNVLIEINNSSFTTSRPGSYDNCKRIAYKALENGNMLTLGSDAHICYEVGRLDKAKKLLQELGADERYIINSSVEKFMKFVEVKRKR